MTLVAWNALSFFWMLGLFSQFYLVGLMSVVIWGIVAFFRIMVGVRSIEKTSGSVEAGSFLRLERIGRKLHSFSSVAFVLATGCFANEIFGVWETYELRVTDANPVFALKEAWAVTQLLICLLIIFDTTRWYAFATLDRFSSDPMSR